MSAPREWYGVVDADGIVVERYDSPEEADKAADELNGVYGPGVDAEYDYKSFTD